MWQAMKKATRRSAWNLDKKVGRPRRPQDCILAAELNQTVRNAATCSWKTAAIKV